MAEPAVETLKENPMRAMRIEKVTVNMAVGKSGEPLERAIKVLNQLTGRTPCQRGAKRTVKEFGIRKGEPIACMATLRGSDAEEFLKRTLEVLGNKLRASSFDGMGNFAFGIKEHIEIRGTKYVPELGIFGMDVIVTLERPGYRVKRRTIRRSKIGRKHLITRDDAASFIRERFGVEIAGD